MSAPEPRSDELALEMADKLQTSSLDMLEGQRTDGMRVARSVMRFRALPWQAHSAIYMLADSYRAADAPAIRDEKALHDFLLTNEACAVIETVIASIYAHAMERVVAREGK